MDGMFAICIIDLLKGVIFAARDKQGIKPLYYYEDSNIFMLASELKAIRAVIPLEINHRAIEMYFSYRFIPAPYTIYNDVFKLKAGEQISFFMHGETTTRHCFQYNYTLPETPFNADDCEKIKCLVTNTTQDGVTIPRIKEAFRYLQVVDVLTTVAFAVFIVKWDINIGCIALIMYLS